MYEVLEQEKLIHGGKNRTMVTSGTWAWGLTGKGEEGTFWGDGSSLNLHAGLGSVGARIDGNASASMLTFVHPAASLCVNFQSKRKELHFKY